MSDVMNFDFTDTTDSGFVMIPEGTYLSKVTEFRKGKSSKGDPMFEVDFEIADGTLKDSSIRMYLPIIEDKPFTKAKFYSLLKTIGVLQESDREANNALRMEVDLGTADEFGKQDVLKFIVNGSDRRAKGKYAMVTVAHRDYTNESGEKTTTHSVKKVDAVPAPTQTTQASGRKPIF